MKILTIQVTESFGLQNLDRYCLAPPSGVSVLKGLEAP